MLRRLAIIAAMCCMQTAHSDAVDDRLHAMSIKQLRWLLRDLGALDELPKGVALEKRRHRLRRTNITGRRTEKRDALNSQRIWLALKVAGMLLVALVFGEPILAATQREARLRRRRRGEETPSTVRRRVRVALQRYSCPDHGRHRLVAVLGAPVGHHLVGRPALEIQASETSPYQSRRWASTRRWRWARRARLLDQRGADAPAVRAGAGQSALLGTPRSPRLMAARHRARRRARPRLR